MIYIDIVNNVLRRLRESEVQTIAQTSYSKLIGDFVNDAKTIVDSAWRWSQYRVEIDFNTTNNVGMYSLTNSGVNPVVVNALNDTTNVFLEYQSPTWFEQQTKLQDIVYGAPAYYTFAGEDGDGDVIVKVYPVPDDAYALVFNVIKDPVDLAIETSDLSIPHQPVIQLAFAMALRERGETGGQSAAEQFGVAETFLSDAIALDAAKNPEELIWKTV
jgi:hypothetical protein